MPFITEWITNIILFILLATVIDLLLPNNNLQRYVKMVTGLLLIVIILTPVLKLMNQDIDQMFSNMNLSTTSEEKKVENLVENKKKEIQATGRAYILEQMAVQMKKQVEKELLTKYGYELQEVKLAAENLDQLKAGDIDQVTVSIREQGDQPAKKSSDIQPVVIHVGEPVKEQKENKDFRFIQSFLAKEWQISSDKVIVDLKGGGS